MKYSIIIPCYNEEENVHDLIQLLEHTGNKYDIQWIMVENGSKDRTRDILECECADKKSFTIAYVDKNRGYGYGLLQGIKVAEGDYIGWLHADMQIAPSEMIKFIKLAEDEKDKKLFLKGKRKNRSIIDYFFTDCMTLYASFMLRTWVYDIGAIPVLFQRTLLEHMPQIPYDFSIETYVYATAKKVGFDVRRYNVKQQERRKGKSSWNKGFASKIRQSRVIMRDIVMIRKGKQVK